MTRPLLLLLVVVLASCGAPARPPSRDLILATTTSVANSGLLDVLVTTCREQMGMRVRSHLVGSGLSLQMLDRHDVDVIITHAPDAEAAALNAHPRWRYRKIMFNDFVLVGPAGDPAGVKGVPSADAAMQRIARADVRFLSRGDSSGTHEREEQLWRRAGVRPLGDRLVVAGAGMGTTLRIASESAAYTLTDRATLAQHQDTLQLAILFEGDPLLLNTYAVIVDASAPRARDAEAFFTWIADGRGRAVIDGYRIRGVAAFTVWPQDVPGDRPDAAPR